MARRKNSFLRFIRKFNNKDNGLMVNFSLKGDFNNLHISIRRKLDNIEVANQTFNIDNYSIGDLVKKIELYICTVETKY